MESDKMTYQSFEQWLESDQSLLVAEGYVMELERRGYLGSGGFVPEAVLENPHIVTQMHDEFVHAGSDVVLALTYNTNRRKLDVIGKKDDAEAINKKALALAKEVAERTGKLFASGISHSMIFAVDKKAEDEIREMYEEQVQWAKESGVQYMVAETLGSLLEARVAIETVKRAGLPIVVTFNLYRPSLKTHEGIHVIDACKMAEDLGADVVGVNCAVGPTTIIPLLKELRQKCKGPLAALPACFHTTEKEPNWFLLTNPETGRSIYPKDIWMAQSCPSEVEEFGKQCQEIGIRYVGLCCGNAGTLMRALAESYDRMPAASRYTLDESKSMKSQWLTE